MQETQETWDHPLGRKDPLEEEIVTHSSILTWRTPWTEGSSWQQSMESQRVGHDWASVCMSIHIQSRNLLPLYVDIEWVIPQRASELLAVLTGESIRTLSHTDWWNYFSPKATQQRLDKVTASTEIRKKKKKEKKQILELKNTMK